MLSLNNSDVLCILLKSCAFSLLILSCNQIFVSSNNHNKRSMITEDYAKAFDHGARVRNEGACHQPRSMIIYVNKTDPSKVHLPRGTVLHRCNDQTGCCSNPSESCVAIEMQTVELYFITITLQVQSPFKNRRVRQSPKIEKLLFTNHTLCGCRIRNSSDQDINSDDDHNRENEVDL
ncbi:uncharacterized protein LOC113796617 isoform X1 [Dermatophagoides pteronyssinus]|uniref:Uncharacterized protein LOC113796617 isoform X1 n=3 Tax=Dermatophagoides pteronyssinus TaxID=6956 RepID=A0A6P6YBQ9_DERPT|nr:uncharacterized protein LOC113796617 isoform X1 [Dermatophagoides pteronyssinus]KAH9426542.1 hypothetical protein DERP_002641 [Dermatophagoides pteronyssinus]